MLQHVESWSLFHHLVATDGATAPYEAMRFHKGESSAKKRKTDNIDKKLPRVRFVRGA
jgi:hypothetical protein